MTAEHSVRRVEEHSGAVPTAPTPPTGTFPATLQRVHDGARFCGLFALPRAAGDAQLLSVVSDDGALVVEEATVAAGEWRYSSLTSEVPAAGWYERRIRDLFGIQPMGHPRLDPLVFPRPPGTHAPLGVAGEPSVAMTPDLTPLAPHVHGEGVFAIPYGPVRSGVFEAIEYLIETSGEDIPHLRTRIFYKHRGLESRFPGMTVEDGVVLAERVEGVASVAHALAFSAAVEQLGGVVVPLQTQLVRVVHAELERVANHLDTFVRHTEAAGQAVAYAVISHHKERVQRLRARLCGSRFGRGAVVPGGVGQPLRVRPTEVLAAVAPLQRSVEGDLRRLMDTPSFVDRLRGTGVLSRDDARQFAVVGPVGRASGQAEDVRTSRPYGGYAQLGHRLAERHDGGDALARQLVRIDELAGAFHLVRQAVDMLDQLGEPTTWREKVPRVSGRAIGWAEAPQGEVLSVVEAGEGQLSHVTQRSASFHNLAAYPSAFPKDIYTDVAFVEASFGLSIAGAAC
jgi:formate hydrogenlyase subunit 5